MTHCRSFPARKRKYIRILQKNWSSLIIKWCFSVHNVLFNNTPPLEIIFLLYSCFQKFEFLPFSNLSPAERRFVPGGSFQDNYSFAANIWTRNKITEEDKCFDKSRISGVLHCMWGIRSNKQSNNTVTLYFSSRAQHNEFEQFVAAVLNSIAKNNEMEHSVNLIWKCLGPLDQIASPWNSYNIIEKAYMQTHF